MRIAILGGYAPRQSVGAVFRAFRRAGHQVFHWPTLPDFDLTQDREPIDMLFSFKIGQDKIPKGWISALQASLKVFWSFDDPHWISMEKNPWFAQEHDIVLTSCQQSIQTYTEKGCPRVHFLPPAMDLEYYRDWKESHAVDALPDVMISFIATNLYPQAHYPNTFVDRSDMVDRVTECFGSDFALYGHTPSIESKPAYRRVLHWENSLPRVIEGTQMNLNTHVQNTDHLYFNERFFQIASTRRAMFVDRMPGYTDLFGEDAFIFLSSLDELIDILEYFRERPTELAKIGQHGFDLLRGWTYDEFVRQVLCAIEGQTTQPCFVQ